jgi:hypothetical protein
MSWWKYAGGLSPGPAAIPNPANPRSLAARLLRTRPASRGWAGAVARESRASGSHRSRYYTDRQPGAASQYTTMCPGPCSRAARAGGQSHGIHVTVIRPGPHSCPFARRSG